MTPKSTPHERLVRASIGLLRYRAACLREIYQRGQQALIDNWVSHFVGEIAMQAAIFRAGRPSNEQLSMVEAWKIATPLQRFDATREAVVSIQADPHGCPQGPGRGGAR